MIRQMLLIRWRRHADATIRRLHAMPRYVSMLRLFAAADDERYFDAAPARLRACLRVMRYTPYDISHAESLLPLCSVRVDIAADAMRAARCLTYSMYASPPATPPRHVYDAGA